MLFPYAALKYKGYGTSISLITNQMGIDAWNRLTKSIENLEFNFCFTIKSLVADQKRKT